MSNALLTVSSEAIEQFNEQGYLILREFLEPEIIQDVRDEMTMLADEHVRQLVADGKVTRTFDDEPFETRLARVFENAVPGTNPPVTFRRQIHRPGFFRLFFNRHLLDAVSGLLGPELRLYPNYSIRSKLPDNEATLVLWHQDAGYTESVFKSQEGSVDQLRMVNLWAPLVPATVENGCMQFIPGSHTLGAVPHVQKNKFYLEIAEEHLKARAGQAVNIELDPGDVVLFSNLLFHRGLPNRSTTVRWSSDWRYQDATQPTLRKENGHLARSRLHPEQVVRSAQHWATLAFT
jgi:phytanoyl-CoA hydroxylase